jgi:hypothetical protein
MHSSIEAKRRDEGLVLEFSSKANLTCSSEIDEVLFKWIREV